MMTDGSGRRHATQHDPARQLYRPADAEPLMHRALAIDEKRFCAEHPASPRASTIWRYCYTPAGGRGTYA
jgi:hypothetical protein